MQKFGDGRVALIGFPSVGKSTLLTQLTGTSSEAAAYEFTTLTCIPGVIHYNDAKIQLLDLPGIIEGAAEGKGTHGRSFGCVDFALFCWTKAKRAFLLYVSLLGRGRQVIAVCKSADLLLMVLDAGKPHYHREILTRELESVGMRCVWSGTEGGRAETRCYFDYGAKAPANHYCMGFCCCRLNRKPPNIYFKKKKGGGVTVNSMLTLTHLDERMVQRIFQVRGSRTSDADTSAGVVRCSQNPTSSQRVAGISHPQRGRSLQGGFDGR